MLTKSVCMIFLYIKQCCEKIEQLTHLQPETVVDHVKNALTLVIYLSTFVCVYIFKLSIVFLTEVHSWCLVIYKDTFYYLYFSFI